MQADFVNIGLGFIEGLALVASPCVLPILPILFAGSVAGNPRRPLGIVLGFVLMFALFTLFSRELVVFIDLEGDTIRISAYAMLLALGVIMLSAWLSDKFSTLTQSMGSMGGNLSSHTTSQGGFLSGLLVGALVALIWTPCAGPILAAVIVQTVIQQTTAMSFVVLIAFGVGVTLPMLLVALIGRSMIHRLSFLRPYAQIIRKILGLLIICSVAFMVYTENRMGVFSATTIEERTPLRLVHGILIPYQAPAIEGIKTWINSKPLTIADLKGHVILVDFWTYSCINCKRTLPYLIDWYKKYHDEGLVIIGVHSPEFEFEKNPDHVQQAVVQDGIKYPVALDNQFTTWRNYKNQYWPAQYLINKQGDVVYTHFGEGDDDMTENNIRYLLGIHGRVDVKDDQTSWASYRQTAETYLGYARAENFSGGSQAMVDDKLTQYAFPESLGSDTWGLQGPWVIMPDRIISGEANAAIEIKFHARHVYVVMGNQTKQPIKVNVLLNGEPITTFKGSDVSDGTLTVDKHSIFEVIDLGKPNDGVLQLIITQPGLELYTFTFG